MTDVHNISIEAIKSFFTTLKVPQLRQILKNAGLPSLGKKAELIDRLSQQAIDDWQIEYHKHYQFFVGKISSTHTVYIFKTHDWFFSLLTEKQASHNYIFVHSNTRGKSLCTEVVVKSKANDKITNWKKNMKEKIKQMLYINPKNPFILK